MGAKVAVCITARQNCSTFVETGFVL